MSIFAPRAGLSRATWLALLFAVSLGVDAPDALPAEAWARVTRFLGRKMAPDEPQDPLTSAERAQISARADWIETMLPDWRDAGWWLLGQADPGFPRRLRRRLGPETPALLWGKGATEPCGRGGVARVRGSAATEPVVALPGAASILVDGARIVIAPEGSPPTELLLSPPGAAVGNGDALNETAWALADAVVIDGVRRGDSCWAGIVALIASDRQPVWLAGMAGDAELLLRAGARPVPPDGVRASVLLAPKPSREARALMHGAGMPDIAGFAEAQAAFGGETERLRATRTPHLRLVSGTPRELPERVPDFAGPPLFEVFLERLLVLLRGGGLGAGPIAESMGLLREQTDLWLLRAVQENAVRFDPATVLYSAV